MAVTSPDNIWTPDSGDEYALTVDLAAMADTVQDAILNRTSMVVADLDELVTATPTSPGKTAVVLSLGAMFRRNSTDTTWVQITPAQVSTTARDVEYAKASGAFLVPTATVFNTSTLIEERYLGGIWVKANAPTLGLPFTNVGLWTATAASTVASFGNGLITVSIQSVRSSSFAPGSSEVIANLVPGYRPAGNVAVGAAAFTTSFPSSAVVIISSNGDITMFNGPAVQETIGFTATFKVA